MADITNPSQPQKHKIPTALEIALSKAETSQTTQPPAGVIPGKELEGGKPTVRTITLGTDVTTGKPVVIDNRDRVKGCYIIGRTGFGKSILLEQLAVQDAQRGHGFCFLDPHGDVLDHILCRMPQERIDRGDVIFVDPMDYKFPYGQNPYECAASDPVTMRQTFNQVEQIFAKVFGMSKETPRLSQYVRNITAVLLANQGMTMCEIPLLLDAYDDRFRKRLVDNLAPSHAARYFWKDYDNMRPLERREDARSTKDRIDALINNDILRYIVGQSKSTIDFQTVMNSGKVLLVKLPGDDEDITTLLGSVIINQLLLAALSRKNIPEKKRRQFNIYADEFQRFAIPSFGQLLVEARKYRIATICANQVLNDLGEQLRPRMLNAGCLVVFNVQDEDATDLAGEFNYAPPQAEQREGTIPRNVLPRLEYHPNPAVKEFWRKRVLPLDEGLRKQDRERIERNMWGREEIVPVLAKHNFGEGEVEYETADLQSAYNSLNDFIYDVLWHPKGSKNQEEFGKAVLSEFAPFLCYTDFYNWHHLGKSWEMTPYLMKISLESAQQVIALTEEIEKINGYLASDDTLVKLCFGFKWNINYSQWVDTSIEEAYEKMREEAQKKSRNAWIMGTYEGGVEELKRAMQTHVQDLKARVGSLQKKTEGKLVSDTGFKGGRRGWKQHVRDYEQRQRDGITRAQQQVIEAEQCLQSEEQLFTYIAKYWQLYKGKTPEQIRADIAESLTQCTAKVAELQQNDTPEKILANKRKEFEQQREEKQRAIEEIDAKRRDALKGREGLINWQKATYLEFVNDLQKVVEILMTYEGREGVKVSTWQAEPVIQQTHTDKRAEIANVLTHLPVGRAWVRLTTSDGERKAIAEHVIDTRMPTGFSEKELERKRTQVVAYTRANYCKPRHEVEEEIRRRQNPDNQLPTTRKHTL